MTVREVMCKRVVAATENATCHDLAKKMLSGFFSGLPVVDKDNHVIGMVTEFDILKVLQENKNEDFCTIRAKDFMSKNLVTISEDAGLDEAIKLLTEKHFIRLPVVKDGKLVGVISRGDILRVFVKDNFITYQDGDIVGEE